MAVKVEEIKKQSVHTYEEVATDLKVMAKENNIETFDILVVMMLVLFLFTFKGIARLIIKLMGISVLTIGTILLLPL